MFKEQDLHAFEGELIWHEKLSHFNTWRVGGEAKLIYKPAGIQDLAKFLKCLPNDEQLFWLGLGSNVLVRDAGFNGTVILTQGSLNGLSQVDDNRVRVEAGVSCAKMARYCARLGFGGGEFWAGIPGTMGGALRMNAGCFNGETWQFVESVETINRSGEIRVRHVDEFQVRYREVVGLASDEWFVAATCRLPLSNEDSFEVIKQLLAHRAATQPTGEYNCGSVFRNPDGNHAAALIDSLGLKGTQVGHAVVSPKHANFIINQEGLATAADIESLIQLVQDTVHEKTGIQLHREVHLIGEKESDVN